MCAQHATGALSGTPDRHPARAVTGEVVIMTSPVWSLRVEGRRLSIVLQRAPLPGGAELGELSVELPHVSFPFDFRDGLERFRHHRGHAEELSVRLESRLILDWLNQASGGQIGGSAYDDQLVLSGRTAQGTRWTMRARLVPDRGEEEAGWRDGEGERAEVTGQGEPLLTLSLYGFRVYGPSSEPWPLMAERVLALLPRELVVDRTLTTARLRVVRLALAHALSALGWKLPDTSGLVARGVELREGRFVARFGSAARGARPVDLDLDPFEDGEDVWGRGEEVGDVRSAFLKFVEDLEVKRHHGQVDRLLGEGKVREALAEVYRALDGPPRPGFLAERLIGITATQPILHDEGERVCRMLLEVAPGYEPALVGLASIALMRKRPEEAAVQLERLAAVVTGPADREDATAVDLTLAQILADFAPEESRAALERVLLRSPDHEEALSELIALAEKEGEVRLALPLYKRLLFAARSKARTREAGLRLARFALQRNEPEDARVLLKVVLESSPDDLEAQVALAEVETREGRGLEALRILEEALRKLPPSDSGRLVKLIVLLGRLLLEVLADPARARRILWRAGDVAQVELGDALELGRLALLAKEPTLALRFAELVADDTPEWSEAQALRAEALAMRGDTKAALQGVLAVLSKEPDHERALSLLEVVTPDAASREWLVHQLYERAERASGDEARARILHRVALLYHSLGLGFDALAPLEEAVFLAPDSERFEDRAVALMALQREFGLWPEYLRVGSQRLVRMRGEGLHDESAVARRVELLTAMGEAAMREVGDLAAARSWLEEAARISPRALVAQEVLTEVLLAQLAEAAGPAKKAVAAALTGVLTRLAALRVDAAGQDEARLLLAELQLDHLGVPGQARATLQKLRAPHGERARQLLARVGSGPPSAGPSVATTRGAPVKPPVSVAGLFDEALVAADRGDDDRARALLAQLLTVDPRHQPTHELLALLGPTPGPNAQATSAPSSPWTPVAPGASSAAARAPVPPSPDPRPPTSPEPTRLADRAQAEPTRPEPEPRPVAPAPSEAPRHSAAPSEPARAAPPPAASLATESALPPTAAMARPAEPTSEDGEAGARIREKAVESDTIDALMAQATERYFADDLDGARDSLEGVLAIDADVVAALELLQEILAAQGDHRRRAEVLSRLTERVFDAAAAAAYTRSLGESLEAAGEDEAARAAYIRYLRSRPLDEPLFTTLARALEAEAAPEAKAALADLWEARADALEDLEDDPGRATALTRAGRAHFAARALPAAEHAVRRALQAMPESAEALELMVRLALAQGRMDVARDHAARLLPLVLPGPDREWLEALASS